jgi:VWFA-related protein
VRRFALLWTSSFLYIAGAFGYQTSVPAESAVAAGEASGNINLYVVANDKSGNPVSGLQEQDFVIRENKQPQKITAFQAANATNDEVREIVLILDTVNTSFTRVAYARDQIDKFLRQDAGRLAHPVSIAVFTDSGLDAPSTPSLDGNALAEYLNKRETGLHSIRRSEGFYGASDRAQLSLRALGQLAEIEQTHPDRKLVVWISPGWPLLSGPNVQLSAKGQRNLFDSIVAMTTQIRRAGMTLYSVDSSETADSSTLRTFYYEEFLKGIDIPKKVAFGDLALQVFVSHSGGRVLNGSNGLTDEIEKCVRDANTYYVLSYESAPADGPNEYRAIEVKISGRSQTKAQTLAGYYAQPSGSRTP